jgi:hypothetical protein
VTENEEAEDVASRADVEEEGALGCRTCGVSCLAILILIGLTFGLLTANAGGRLDARVSEVSQEILDLQDAADHRRATVVASPRDDQNAVADYNGFMWVLATGRENDIPQRWRDTRPPLPDDVEDMVKRVAPNGVGMDSVETAYLSPAFEPGFTLESLDPNQLKRFKASRKLFQQFRPLLRYIRDGLSRGKCDWQVNWEKGANVDVPNLLQLRGAANMLSYEATLQSPREGLQTGLEIVAFGEDCARHGSVIGAMIGVAIAHLGFQSLARTLERPGLEIGDYQRVIDALAAYRPPLGEDLLRAERVCMTVALLQMSGRSVDQSEPAGGMEGLMGSGGGAKFLLSFDATHAREIDGYEGFSARGAEIARLPRAERRAATERLNRELADSNYLVAKHLYLNVDQCLLQLDQSLGMSRVVRALAAAHQVRIQTGAFPRRIEALGTVLGEGLEDPTSNVPGTPLGYAVNSPYIRCWLAGENGANDGGQALKLPRPKWTAGPKRKKRKKGRRGGKQTSGVGGGGDDVGLQSVAPVPASAPAETSEGR